MTPYWRWATSSTRLLPRLTGIYEVRIPVCERYNVILIVVVLGIVCIVLVCSSDHQGLGDGGRAVSRGAHHHGGRTDAAGRHAPAPQ